MPGKTSRVILVDLSITLLANSSKDRHSVNVIEDGQGVLLLGLMR